MRPHSALSRLQWLTPGVSYDAVLTHAQNGAIAPTSISSFINVIHEADYADDQEPCLQRGRAGI